MMSRMTLFGPGCDHAGRALGTDAVQLLQTVGGLPDDIEDLSAEGLHQLAGEAGTDAFTMPEPRYRSIPSSVVGARRAAAWS